MEYLPEEIAEGTKQGRGAEGLGNGTALPIIRRILSTKLLAHCPLTILRLAAISTASKRD